MPIAWVSLAVLVPLTTTVGYRGRNGVPILGLSEASATDGDNARTLVSLTVLDPRKLCRTPVVSLGADEASSIQAIDIDFIQRPGETWTLSIEVGIREPGASSENVFVSNY